MYEKRAHVWYANKLAPGVCVVAVCAAAVVCSCRVPSPLTTVALSVPFVVDCVLCFVCACVRGGGMKESVYSQVRMCVPTEKGVSSRGALRLHVKQM
jgi:hypothetical protein